MILLPPVPVPPLFRVDLNGISYWHKRHRDIRVELFHSATTDTVVAYFPDHDIFIKLASRWEMEMEPGILPLRMIEGRIAQWHELLQEAEDMEKRYEESA